MLAYRVLKMSNLVKIALMIHVEMASRRNMCFMFIMQKCSLYIIKQVSQLDMKQTHLVQAQLVQLT